MLVEGPLDGKVRPPSVPIHSVNLILRPGSEIL
jgi:hypothetical protein